VGKPLGCAMPPLRVVQFPPYPPDPTDYARDGGGDHGSCVGTVGVAYRRITAMSITNAMCTNVDCDWRPHGDMHQKVPSFCEICGSPIIQACPHCNTPTKNQGGAFCSNCGEQLRFKKEE
jgi:hypothetical protein